jgi:hypothetical protein
VTEEGLDQARGGGLAIRKLLDDTKVLRCLNAHYADLVPEFESIATSETL